MKTVLRTEVQALTGVSLATFHALRRYGYITELPGPSPTRKDPLRFPHSALLAVYISRALRHRLQLDGAAGGAILKMLGAMDDAELQASFAEGRVCLAWIEGVLQDQLVARPEKRLEWESVSPIYVDLESVSRQLDVKVAELRRAPQPSKRAAGGR